MPDALREWAPYIAAGGGLTTALLAGKALHHAGKTTMESVPEYKRKPKTFQEAKKDYGVNVGYSHGGDFENAASIPKGELKDAYEDEKTVKLKKLIQKAKQHGIVMTAQGYRRPGIVEHELGHTIAREKGTPWEKFTHSRAANALYNVSQLAGMGAGIYAGGKYGPLAGAAAGLGTSALAGAPFVHGEMIANRYGNELLPEDKPRIATWPFVGSYINRAITAPTIAGGLTGLLAHR